MENKLPKPHFFNPYWTFVIFVILCGFLLDIRSLEVGPYPVVLSADASSNDAVDLKKLLVAAGNPGIAASLDLSQYKKYLDPKRLLRDQSPVWPIHSFLIGEVYRLRGDTAQAKKVYQELVNWAATDPYRDGWGVSGLVDMALWRWLQIISTTSHLNPDEGEHLLKITSEIWNTRLAQGMFLPPDPDIFSAIHQLKEDILRRLTSLAWSMGKKKDAQRLFIEYLAVSRTAELSPIETTLFEESVSSGVLSRGQVALFRGKRLDFLRNYEGAFDWFNKARESGTTQVKAEASLYLARLRRKLKGERCASPEVLNLLGTAIDYSADPDVVQDALFLRAIISNREGCPKDVHQFKKDLNRLIEDFQLGRRADDALYQLALYYLELYWREGKDLDLEEALRLFGQLRNFKGENDFIDSSRFKPAMALYSRGRPGDIQRASSLLQELEMERPFGPLHLNALFWLGRMAAESGDEKESKSYFKKIIEESPYNYYAIRARLHLNLGNRASKEFLIDPKTKDELQRAFRESKNAISLSGSSPYHIRLRKVLESGIYSMAMGAYSSLRKEFPSQRLEYIPLEKLDEKNILPHVGILLATRQDALAAIDLPPDPVNRLEIAGAIGHSARDWPLVIYIIGASDKPYEVKAATQRDTRYLVTSHPVVFREWIKKYSADYNLPVELIYSVIRHESAFYPEALSREAALGLFQFTPTTFQALNKRWDLVKIKEKSSSESFLLDPELSIYLGARYFKEELLKNQKGNLVLALMEHVSGTAAVKEWGDMWNRIRRANDYEFILETARHSETGEFARMVLTTFWIVQAAGIYLGN